jgi:hypothetical protein
MHNGLVDLPRGPATHGGAPMQENLQQADDPYILSADAGIARGADGDVQGGWLQKRKVHVHMESLKADKAARGGRKLLRHGTEVIQSFPQPEIRKMVRQRFVAQETGELLRLSEKGFLGFNPHDAMAVVDRFDDGGQVAA